MSNASPSASPPIEPRLPSFGRRRTPLRFGLVSFGGSLVDMLVMIGAVSVFQLPAPVAKIVATECSVTHNFTWHTLWTFRDNPPRDWRALARRFVSFNATYLSSMLLAILFIAVCVALWSPRYYVLYNLATTPGAFAWNYLWSRRVTWRERHAADPDRSVSIDQASTMMAGRLDLVDVGDGR